VLLTMTTRPGTPTRPVHYPTRLRPRTNSRAIRWSSKPS